MSFTWGRCTDKRLSWWLQCLLVYAGSCMTLARRPGSDLPILHALLTLSNGDLLGIPPLRTHSLNVPAVAADTHSPPCAASVTTCASQPRACVDQQPTE